MSEHADKVRPRVRGNSVNPHSEPASSTADRVLIRLPEISSAAQLSITPMSNPVVGGSQHAASLPKTEKPAISSPAHRVVVEPFHREPNRTARIDPPHSIAPGPHATAPDWLDQSEGGVIKRIRRRALPLIVTAGIIFIVVVVVRGRWVRNPRPGGPTQSQAATQQNLPSGAAGISNDTTQSIPLPDRLAAKSGDTNVPQGEVGNSAQRSTMIQSTTPTTIRAIERGTQWTVPSASNVPAAVAPSIELPAQPAPRSDANSPASVGPQPAGEHPRAAWLDGTIISPPALR
jgi:hypothetical protein